DVLDATTGHNVLTIDVPATVSNPKVFFNNGFGILAYSSGANLKVLTVNATTFAQTTSTLAGTFNVMDIRQLNGTTIQIVGTNGTGNAVAADFVPSTNTFTAWSPRDSGGVTFIIGTTATWMSDFGGSGKIALIADDNVAGLQVYWDFPSSGATR